jgi:hypothetical protein
MMEAVNRRDLMKAALQFYTGTTEELKETPEG